jgi:hypothetical protein
MLREIGAGRKQRGSNHKRFGTTFVIVFSSPPVAVEVMTVLTGWSGTAKEF